MAQRVLDQQDIQIGKYKLLAAPPDQPVPTTTSAPHRRHGNTTGHEESHFDTLEVVGFNSSENEETLRLFFESKRCGDGLTKYIKFDAKEGRAIVAFDHDQGWFVVKLLKYTHYEQFIKTKSNIVM